MPQARESILEAASRGQRRVVDRHFDLFYSAYSACNTRTYLDPRSTALSYRFHTLDKGYTETMFRSKKKSNLTIEGETLSDVRTGRYSADMQLFSDCCSSHDIPLQPGALTTVPRGIHSFDIINPAHAIPGTWVDRFSSTLSTSFVTSNVLPMIAELVVKRQSADPTGFKLFSLTLYTSSFRKHIYD